MRTTGKKSIIETFLNWFKKREKDRKNNINLLQKLTNDLSNE